VIELIVIYVRNIIYIQNINIMRRYTYNLI